MPEVSIAKCESCNRVFHTDDFELQSLQKGHCPFCRSMDYYNALRIGRDDENGDEETQFLVENE
ncbi:Uncharacterized protein FKW44_023985 [Caligus rogercresseyi]|uniref:Uncharacterized protein n=1 Tax=Caligus rogercresseyi TaxID=217165 RepID=A0A7T8JVS5_CALRO|nr:Uncharacterized protein FKW44_023985 [Caligus rogercresseyi]